MRFYSLLKIVCYSVMHAKIQMKRVPKMTGRITLPRNIMIPMIKCSYFKQDNFKMMGHFFWLTLYTEQWSVILWASVISYSPIDRGSDRPIIEKGPVDRLLKGSDRPRVLYIPRVSWTACPIDRGSDRLMIKKRRHSIYGTLGLSDPFQ